MKNSEKAIVAAGILAFLGIGYAIYFDHKRRNDPKFRRKLKRGKKRAEKERKQKEVSENNMASLVTAALEQCQGDVLPTSIEGKEKYFIEQVGIGESLLPKGESAYQEAAVYFYRALRVYPSPMELVMMLQKTIPTKVFQIVMSMMQVDLVNKQEKYYDLFPPEEMNVRLKKMEEIPQPDGSKIIKRALLSTGSFEPGEVIFTEMPTVSALYPTLDNERFCSHCLKTIPFNEPTHFCEKCGENTRFCSEKCYKEANVQYHPVLCVGGYAETDSKARSLIKLIKEAGLVTPIAIARFLTQTVQAEQARVANNEPEMEYSVWEHLERLKYLELQPNEQDREVLKQLTELLEEKVPGIAEFFTDERFMTFKGRLLYNAYSITSTDSNFEGVSESKEGSRYNGTGKPIGMGLYKFAAHLTHSCEPNCEVRFLSKKYGNELSLVALRPITKEEQLNVTFVANSPDDHLAERREKLAKGWRFKCACNRCVREEEESMLRDPVPLLEEYTDADISTKSQEVKTTNGNDEEIIELDAESESESKLSIPVPPTPVSSVVETEPEPAAQHDSN